jgi:hypothetical protein
MGITGGSKFFLKSKCLDATISATSGDAASANAIDINPISFWRSVGTTDATTETITVTFNGDKTIDRIFLVDTNAKQFTVKYDNSGTWTDFANVIGLDGSKASISETAFADDTAYYEFDSVTTGSIQITLTTTQVANQEKYLCQIIATEEMGTFVGYPEWNKIKLDRNDAPRRTVGGKYSIIKSNETFEYQVAMKNYPSSSVYNVDIDLVMSFHDSDEEFIVWPCGGRRGTDYFRYTIRGFRLKDVRQVQMFKEINISYMDNIYVNPVDVGSFSLVEHI